MKKLFFILACIVLLLPLRAQNIKKELKALHTDEEIAEYLKTHDNAQRLLRNDLMDSSAITKRLVRSAVGDIFKDGEYTYKVLSTGTIRFMRVSYIYLDGSKYSLHQVDSLRTLILDQYKNGVAFVDLVKKYTMDMMPDGDLGWFDSYRIVEPFWNEVAMHKKGDIFKVDVYDNKWFYVVLKTFDDLDSNAALFLRVSDPK